MIDLQRALVADHIADLAREASSIRAERELDHLRGHAGTGSDGADHPAHAASRRVRLGRWLVAVGESIAGPRPMAAAHNGEPRSASFRAEDGPCDDGNDRLATAA